MASSGSPTTISLKDASVRNVVGFASGTLIDLVRVEAAILMISLALAPDRVMADGAVRKQAARTVPTSTFLNLAEKPFEVLNMTGILLPLTEKKLTGFAAS
jgi:hypothetical protein